MRSSRIKKLMLLVTLLFASLLMVVRAEAANDPAVEKFQAWLKDYNNKKASARRAPQQPQQVAQRQQQPAAGSQQVQPPRGATNQITPPVNRSAPQPKTMTQDQAINEAAYQSMLKQAMPLTPQQIIKFKELMQQSQRAAATDVSTPPKPVSSTVMVSLAPGSTPPAIRLYNGFISSLVFVDSAGHPWPIQAYDMGNRVAFNVQWDGKGNTLMVQPLKPYTYGNLAVNLVGLSTPVMLTLVPGQRVVDYRADLRIDGLGPETKSQPQGDPLPQSAKSALLGVLDGVAPSGAKLLKVSGGYGQAWAVGSKMYLRTNLTLLSPAWLSRMHSVDGTNAYYLQRVPSILVSRYGEPVELRIKDGS